MTHNIDSSVRDITNKMRLRREALNYTQAYVAGKLGISQNAYSKIESGQTNFTVKRLFEVANILETDVLDFIH
jgi:transcriptional regulator with XRE-family HTH domain